MDKDEPAFYCVPTAADEALMELIDRAEAKLAEIRATFERSPLPERPDTARMEEALFEIRDKFYRTTPTS